MFSQLETRLNSLEATRAQLEALFRGGSLAQDALDNAYVGLYVTMCVEFEGFLENLFLSLLLDGAGVVQTGVAPTVVVGSQEVVKAMVIGPGKDYADWLPYDRTEQKANIFFQSGKPFTNVSGDQKGYVKEIMYLRNALAHSSEYSRRVFLDKVIQQRPLSNAERTPIGFLRVRISNGRTIYQEHRLRLLNIANTLTT